MIEIPLTKHTDTYKLCDINHIGSQIIFANTSDFYVSIISNLPTAIAISKDNTRWIELSQNELSACRGEDILTCLGVIAYRALAPTTAPSTNRESNSKDHLLNAGSPQS